MPGPDCVSAGPCPGAACCMDDGSCSDEATLADCTTAGGTWQGADFESARNLRQKTRAAGLDPDYWYAVEQDKKLAPGQVGGLDPDWEALEALAPGR